MSIHTEWAGGELLYIAACDRCERTMLVTASRKTLNETLAIYMSGWRTGEPIICTECRKRKLADAEASAEYNGWTGGRSQRYTEAKRDLRRARRADRKAAQAQRREGRI